MKRILLLLALFSAACMISQNQNKIDSLKKLGRNKLIALAAETIKDPAFKADNYDRIIVKADKKNLIVIFGLSVLLVEKKACFYDWVSVALVGDGTGRALTGDCDKPEFYQATEARKKKINFVFDAINKSEEIGHMPDKKVPEGAKMTITEQGGHYYVEMSDSSTFSHYKVDKGSGKISEAGHKHYAQQPEEKDEFEIIR